MPRALRDLVADRRAELGLSLRQTAEKSQGLISSSHIGYIEAGNDVDVSDRVLTGLSVALDLPIEKVRKAAGVRPAGMQPFVLPERANRLTARERRLVVSLIDTLLAARREP